MRVADELAVLQEPFPLPSNQQRRTGRWNKYLKTEECGGPLTFHIVVCLVKKRKQILRQIEMKPLNQLCASGETELHESTRAGILPLSRQRPAFTLRHLPPVEFAPTAQPPRVGLEKVDIACAKKLGKGESDVRSISETFHRNPAGSQSRLVDALAYIHGALCGVVSSLFTPPPQTAAGR